MPPQSKTAVTVSYSCGAATAHSSLQQTRDISFFSLSGSPSKPLPAKAAVGIIAWWSETLALLMTRPISGVSSAPCIKGSTGSSAATRSVAVCAISSVR